MIIGWPGNKCECNCGCQVLLLAGNEFDGTVTKCLSCKCREMVE